jgi:hypothetical protein
MRSTLFLLVLALLGPGLLAQSHKEINRHRVFQLSLIYPLSTNGIKAGQTSTNLSLNLLAGYNGELNGIEMGGFLNAIRYNANGIQMSGFGNIVGRNLNGLQMSGFFNMAAKYANGVQLAGFANLAGKDANGFQSAGFANITGGSLHGTQMAGFLNLNGRDAYGLQMAGFANIAPGRVKGVQMSGFLNYAGSLRGLQIGVVNYIGELEKGAAIGVVNIVREGGIKAVSYSRNEIMNHNLSLRMGTPWFYNVFSYGWGPGDLNRNWSIGYGIGAMTKPEKNLGLQVEAIAYQLYEDGTWDTDALNMVNRLQANLQLRLIGGISLYGGAAWNVGVSNRVNREGIVGSSLLPEKLYFDELTPNGDFRVSMWPGLQAGVMLEL